MAWRVPTTEDLIASASAREVEAFQRSASWNGAEPAAELVRQAAGVLRGYLRRGGVRMSPVEGAIPGDLMGPVMDYAVYALCRRIGNAGVEPCPGPHAEECRIDKFPGRQTK